MFKPRGIRRKNPKKETGKVLPKYGAGIAHSRPKSQDKAPVVAQALPPPPAEVEVEPGPPPMDETEQVLLNLHSALIDFYTKHKPDNVDEDVLTILMQFFIDNGGVALNTKLKRKYGEDLNTFERLAEHEEPPPPATLANMMRRSLESEYDIRLPPPPKFEAMSPKEFKSSTLERSYVGKKKRGRKQITDPELLKFHAMQPDVKKELEAGLEEFFGTGIEEEEEDDSLKLSSLDTPKTDELSPRDLIEAFYSKHDPSKLESHTGVEKFVMWAEQNSLEKLDAKLKTKYPEGLFEQKKLARRRRNLEDLLTAFYVLHDKPKLETRWTIMKILNWTMAEGVVALNEKFLIRYGFPVVDIELDI